MTVKYIWFGLANCHYCQTVYEVSVHKCYIYCFLVKSVKSFSFLRVYYTTCKVYSAQIGRIASLYVLIDDTSSSKYSVSTS